MPLDILVINTRKKSQKSIPLYIEEYDSIMDKLDEMNGFPVLQKTLIDYYGESEIYLNQLEVLYAEVMNLKKLFDPDGPKETLNFLNDFLALIKYAIEENETMKFIGD